MVHYLAVLADAIMQMMLQAFILHSAVIAERLTANMQPKSLQSSLLLPK